MHTSVHNVVPLSMRVERVCGSYTLCYYPNITKSKLIYNYTFKQNADALACGIHEFTKGAIGSCNHSGSKKKYSLSPNQKIKFNDSIFFNNDLINFLRNSLSKKISRKSFEIKK